MKKNIGGVKWQAVPAKIDFGARLLSIWHIQVKYGWKRGGKPVLRVKLIPNVPSIWNYFNLFGENVWSCVSDYLCSFCNYTVLMPSANGTLQHNDLSVIKHETATLSTWLRNRHCSWNQVRNPNNWKRQIKNKLTKNVFTIYKHAHCCCPALSRLCSG